MKVFNKAKAVIAEISKDSTDFHNRLDEVAEMLGNVYNANFTTIANAKKLTGLSYLAGNNSSAKIVKGQKKNYNTLVLYLAASDMSGFNVCPMATDGCRQACLVESGRAKMLKEGEKINNITWSRLKKTWLFYANREFFNGWLNAEIAAGKRKADKEGKNFAVRLNGTSDILMKRFSVGGELLLDIHSDVQFYDYTKIPKNLLLALSHRNYDVTFSFANTHQHKNIINSCNALAAGHKIAVCFDKKAFGGEFPKTFLGYEVANGDETDLTFLQEKQVLGLDVKKVKKDQTGNQFIVTPELLGLLEK